MATSAILLSFRASCLGKGMYSVYCQLQQTFPDLSPLYVWIILLLHCALQTCSNCHRLVIRLVFLKIVGVKNSFSSSSHLSLFANPIYGWAQLLDSLLFYTFCVSRTWCKVLSAVLTVNIKWFIPFIRFSASCVL